MVCHTRVVALVVQEWAYHVTVYLRTRLNDRVSIGREVPGMLIRPHPEMPRSIE